MSVLTKILGIFGSPKKKGAVRPIRLRDRFELANRIGQGSMSKVWRAYDRHSGRNICLKILDKEKTARFDSRFVGLQKPNEGVICVALKHKNIVTTLDWGMSTEGQLFLVMEFIEGVGMNFLIETRSKQLDGRKQFFLEQAATALAYVHEQGYIHRDICPRNMMVSPDGVLKLIDFGLSIPNRPEFRRPGNRTGTANYMAPELIKRQTTDERVDLFALGVTAYEMFTNTQPWEGTQSLQTMLSHVNNEGKDPQEAAPDLDDHIAAFLRKAIQRDPRDRFQSANEFREVLRSLPVQGV